MTIPFLPVVMEFSGYWENEPGNGYIIHINLSGFTHISTFSTNPNNPNEVLEYAIHLPGEEFPFVVTADQLNLTTPIGGAGVSYGDN